MQQKLAVASILVLTLLAGMSVVVIQSHAANASQSSPNGSGQNVSGGGSQASTGGSLLVSGNQAQSGSLGDDGHEVENESEISAPSGFDS